MLVTGSWPAAPVSAHRSPVLRSAVAAVGLLFILVCPASAAENTRPRNVLILMAAEYGLPAYDVILHEIRTALSGGITDPLNLYAEYMDIARFSSANHQQALLDFYNQKYGAMKIDLLIAFGPNLAPFFANLSDRFFSEVPTIIIDLAYPDAELPIAFRKANMTGVFPVVDMQKAIGTALALHTGTEHLFIISGASAMDLSLLAQAKIAGRRYKDAIVVEDFNRMSMQEILSAVSALPDHSVVLFTAMQKDATGVPFYSREAVRLVAARSKTPVYVLFDTNTDVGGVGGYVISFKQVGIETGQIALRILQGEDPAVIPPVREGLYQYQFDWRQLERWGIPEDRLPAGSVLLHREESFFEKYFWLVMGTLAFITLQTGLIAYLVVLNRRQKTLSTQLREAEGRYRELLRVERTARLGEMAGSLAHELNQPLAAILSSAQAALRFLKSGRMEPALIREILTHIVNDDKRAASVISGMRSMLKKGTPDFERLDVNRTVAEVVAIFQGEAVARRTRVDTDLNHALPPVMANKNELLQVFLNLLLNAAQAMASNRGDDRQVVITTRVIGPNVVVSVRDIGTGIESDRFDRLFEALYTTKAKGMGMGLAVCRSIVENHGGRIRAENNPDRGATFTIELLAVTNG
jgi:signal transduction histidine kinase